jgi:predicted transcriptional regulator
MMSNARDKSLVKKRREELGMLLIDLAAKIDRSAAFVSTIEGGFVPKLPAMLKIADALDTTPDVLWPDEVEVVDD